MVEPLFENPEIAPEALPAGCTSTLGETAGRKTLPRENGTTDRHPSSATLTTLAYRLGSRTPNSPGM